MEGVEVAGENTEVGHVTGEEEGMMGVQGGNIDQIVSGSGQTPLI